MKIIYYTDQVYLHGGIEKVLTQKLNYLAALPNFEIHLITSEQKNKKFCYPISANVKHHDLAINYDRAKSYLSLVNLKKVPTHCIRLQKKIKEINPNVLIVCNYAFDFYFIPFICRGIKTIKEFHSSRHYYIKNLPKATIFSKWTYRINNWIETKYTHIVVLNKDEKKYYNANNIEIIPNAILNLKTNKTIQRKNTIIAAGRIAQVKQFDHLIKAWSIIAEKHPDWEVHIYGEGDTVILNKLKTLIETLNVPNIYLKEATNNLNVKMSEAAIYALTSATECFPMVLLESLACGLPIVSYNCPHGPKNIITNGEDGVLVQHNNVTAFANELAKLINNKELRGEMGEKALKNIKRFEENKIMQQWLNLFKRVDNDF